MSLRFVLCLAAFCLLAPVAGRSSGLTPMQLQALLASGPSGSPVSQESVRAMTSENAISAIAAGAVQAQGGDGSLAVVTARTGGSVLSGAVPRSLASRFGAVVDLRDYGAVCNGTTDDTAAFQAAQNAAQGLGGATLQLGGAGTCNLGTVYTVSNNGWEFGSNLHLNGTVSGVLDDISHVRRTIAFQSGNDVGESNLFLSQDDVLSSGTASYQKNGVYVRLLQEDPSTYNGTINNVDQVGPNKDSVDYEAQITIPAGNLSGRIYGYHAEASVASGGDGNVNVAELELANNGTYTPQVARFNSKRVVHVTCIGSVDCTEGIDIDGSAHYHAALSSFQNVIRTDGYFLYYGASNSMDTTTAPVFGVAQSGKLSGSAGAAFTGGLSSDSLAVSGSASFGGLIARTAADGLTAPAITAPASGVAPSGALTLSNAVSRVTGCASGSALQLPSGAAVGSSYDIVLINRSGAACTVYPPSGGRIESGAANVPVSIASGADQAFRSLGPLSWAQ